jgi:hypothetical protein
VASSVAPPKNTGGGGFVFEDDVCAWLLACMLAQEPPLEPELGSPIRIAFQTRVDGWHLDDALVTTVKGAHQRRIALSIKSNTQFTASTAPGDFVKAVWEQRLHIGSSVLQEDDLLGLLTAPLSSAAAASLSGLMGKALAGDPTTLPSRLVQPGWASDEERTLFASFACPSSVPATPSPSEADTARLLQRLRFLHHDFGAVVSESLKRSLALCRTSVRSHSSHDAEALWAILRTVAAELRPLAGTISLQQLVERLRSQVSLADHPDHTTDWTNLDARSKSDATQIADSIAGRVRLPRDADVDVLTPALEEGELVALLGASGAGKSAVARSLFERRAATDARTLWLDARSLDCQDFGIFEAALRIQHPIAELLASATSLRPTLILDGLDRLYSDNAFRNVARLLILARQNAPATRWRVLAPCQSQEWPRALDGLERAGAVGLEWKQLQLEPLNVVRLKPVGDAIAALARLFLQPKLGALFANLKFLDLVARRIDAGGEVDLSSWVGESSIADWFWSAEIDRGQDRIARGRFARALAQRQADDLVSSVATDNFEISELDPMESLAADHLCVQLPGDRIAFAHDLYGDWARLRVLLNNRAELPAFFEKRQGSPLWHRALRLLGIHLLEHAGGVDDWRSLLASFAQTGSNLLQDVLLEAPVFGANARTLLDSVFPDLVADEGRMLRRMLTRFLAFATVPDLQKVALAISLGIDPATARATYRLPYWPLWLDLLAFLHAHSSAILAVASSELARIVEMWLAFAPKGSIRRPEAADLAVLLGRHALGTRETYGRGEWQRERERFYTCALTAAYEKTEEVVAIAQDASQRGPAPSAADSAPAEQHQRRRGWPFRGTGEVRGPWPDGPRARVDEALQNVVLDSPSIMDLYRARPAAAREIILANLIQEPVEDDWNERWMYRRKLNVVDRHGWLPSLYIQGPFLGCLRENFAEGLELIARLVEFAAAREREEVERDRTAGRAQAITEGQSETTVDELLAQDQLSGVTLVGADETRVLPGDERVYGWSAGVGTPPHAVLSAIMALEQYFYLSLDSGKDIVGEVAAVLARCESVALLGMLCDVGKRQRSLFEGPLQSLLSAPEIYEWDIAKRVQGRTLLMIGAFDKGELFVKLARDFNDLEHRKVDLRHVAISLMLQRPSMREYFDRVRAAWAAEPPRSGRIDELRQQLTIALNIENYEIRDDPEHGRVIVNVEAMRAEEAQAGERKAFEDKMLVTMFPSRCRTILDERQELDEKRLGELWEQWNRIRELGARHPELPDGDRRFGDEYGNAVAGGVAVFLWHSDWGVEDAARLQALTDALRNVLANPPESPAFDSDVSVATWTFECFAAEAVAMLWARDPTNAEWRQAVAEAVFVPKYAVAKLLFGRCAQFRRTLGEDLGRLRRLALEWAYVRERVDLLRRVPREALQVDDEAFGRVQKNLSDWIDTSRAAFVSASSRGMPQNWAECDVGDKFTELDCIRRRWPGRPQLDFHLVRCAHEWLPLPDGAENADERKEVIFFWRSALAMVISRPQADLTQHDRQYPEEDELWVLNHVGASLLQLRPDEQPELLWQPVLDLHSEGHDWPETLLHSIHRNALAARETPASYASLVRSLLQRAFVDVDGKRRWSWHEGVWDALLGVDGWSRDLWEERHLETVTELQDAFRLWMEKVPMQGRRLAAFSSWLARSPAKPLRLPGLQWIAGLVRVDKEHELWDVEEAEDAVARLLNVVWAEQEGDLRAEPASFQAFRTLLGWLGEQQNRLGLELLGRLGSLT